jgi:hypothetical protein
VSRGIRQRRGINFIGNTYMGSQEKGKGILSGRAKGVRGLRGMKWMGIFQAFERTGFGI